MTSFSDLPEDIVYKICCCMYLTAKRVIELSLVSKQFSSILEKHPALVFRSWDSHPEKQLKYTISTLERYHEHNIPLNKFSFYLGRNHSCSTTHVYDRCIQMAAAQKGLRSLCLSMPTQFEFEVKSPVFEVDSLLKLTLSGCSMQLPKRVAWRNLRQLRLYDVDIGQGVFLNIIKSCPLIETLDVSWCSGDFQYEYLSRPTLYQNLKNLTLALGFGPGISRATILDIPRLERLRISNGDSKTMNISSPTLKRIDYTFWDFWEGPQHVHFNAPNMVDFMFTWYWTTWSIDGNGFREIRFPKLSFAGNSSGWFSRIELAMSTEVRSCWLQALERLLKIVSDALNSSEIASLTIDLTDKTVPNADEMTVPRERIPGIQDFYIKSKATRFCLASARSILDGIFLICHPKRVTFDHFNKEHDGTETAPLFEYRVKFPWPDHDEFMEVLKNHEKEDMFSVVFNLEY